MDPAFAIEMIKMFNRCSDSLNEAYGLVQGVVDEMEKIGDDDRLAQAISVRDAILGLSDACRVGSGQLDPTTEAHQ